MARPLWHAALKARIPIDSTTPDAAIIRAMDAELALGRPDRASLLLAQHGLTDSVLEGERLVIEAAGAFGSKEFARAGERYAAAAGRFSGLERGMLAARAGDAFARAGDAARAAAQYRTARDGLPAIAGWLALREAQVTADTGVAFHLLEQAPTAARKLVPRVRGEFFALSGDTARAVAVLAGAGFDGRAAALALAAGDSINARQLTYRGLRSGDTAVANASVMLANGPVKPRSAEEFLLLARAVRRESAARAAALAGQAVTAGDTSARMLLLWGDLLTESGQAAMALPAYERAARTGEAEAAHAELQAARTLIRLGRPAAALPRLRAFTTRFPDHIGAPLATFLLADLAGDAGRRAESDSLYDVVLSRWPANDYASQGRIRLATRALQRGDSIRAMALYRGEADARGGQQQAARFLLGNLAARRGDTATSSSAWSELARVDSLGYYGSLARARLGLPAPAVAAPERRPPPPDLAAELVQLDLLDAVGFSPEATTLVDWLVAEAGDGERALDVAEALAERGRTVQAVGLGWRATRTYTLNDGRVLRAIYPWPMRSIMENEAREFQLDPYLMAALVRQESTFDIGARSRVGARGLMQVMPATARQAARRMGLEWSDYLLHVPDANLHVGAAHLAILLKHYAGDKVPALAAYNAGQTPVARWRRTYATGDGALFVERIPYPETRGYVRSVLRNLTIYHALYPETIVP